MFIALTVAITILVGSTGQLLLKYGVDQTETIQVHGLTDVPSVALRVLSIPAVAMGLACYAMGTLVWLAVLSRLDLNVAYPMLSLTFVVVPVLSVLFLGERVPATRWAGIAVIILGVTLVARGDWP